MVFLREQDLHEGKFMNLKFIYYNKLDSLSNAALLDYARKLFFSQSLKRFNEYHYLMIKATCNELRNRNLKK